MSHVRTKIKIVILLFFINFQYDQVKLVDGHLFIKKTAFPLDIKLAFLDC